MPKVNKAPEWEQMLLRRGYGMGTHETARDIGTSPSVVSGVFNAFDAVKAADWDKCCELITNWRLSIELFKWAASKLGVELPDTLEKAYQARLNANREKKAEAKAQEEIADRVTAENERIFTLKMLELLAKTNELLEQLMDVVIPKYCADIKDNINVNGDLVCERLKACEDSLAGIKANTRKRGL